MLANRRGAAAPWMARVKRKGTSSGAGITWSAKMEVLVGWWLYDHLGQGL